MKKISKSPRVQARRQRALDRFTIDAQRAKADAAYAARKDQELASLKSLLSV